MTVILEASERPITDMLHNGVAYVPGFYDNDEDALREASDTIEVLNGGRERSTHSLDLLSKNKGTAHGYLVEKALALATDSEEVRSGRISAPNSDPVIKAKQLRAGTEIPWHIDKRFIAAWYVMVIVTEGTGTTKIGGNLPIIGRMNSVTIESKAGDLLLLRGPIPAYLTLEFPRAQRMHRVKAGEGGRKMLGTD